MNCFLVVVLAEYRAGTLEAPEFRTNDRHVWLRERMLAYVRDPGIEWVVLKLCLQYTLAVACRPVAADCVSQPREIRDPLPS